MSSCAAVRVSAVLLLFCARQCTAPGRVRANERRVWSVDCRPGPDEMMRGSERSLSSGGEDQDLLACQRTPQSLLFVQALGCD
jgi:hypothetical protein